MPKRMNMLAVLCVVGCLGGSGLAQENQDTTKRPALAGSQWDAGVTLSWQDLGETGNAQRLFKYDRPSEGLFLGELSLTGRTAEGYPLLSLSAFDVGKEDEGALLRWNGVNSPVSLRWEVNRYQFFADPMTVAALGSKRNENDLVIKLALDGPIPNATLHYRRQQLAEPAIGRLGAVGLGFDSKEYGIETAFPFGPGVLGLSYGKLSFDDMTGAQPSRDTDTINVNYDLEWGDRVSLSALYARAKVEQTGGMPGADTEALQLRGRYVGDRYNLAGALGTRWVNQPGTVNAYTRQTNTADVRARYRLYPGLTLNAGYNRLDYERINRGHTLVATPRRNTTWVKARARLPHGLRLSAKYKQQDLKGDPLSGIPGSATTTPLYRDDVEQVDVRVSGPLGRLGQGYAFYTNNDVRNTFRGSNYVVETYGGGVFSQLTPKLSVTVDALKQDWNGLTNTADAVGLALNAGLPFTADEEVVTLTADYQLDEVTSLSGFFTKYRGQEGALINDHDFGLAVRRALRNDLSCGLEWRRYSHDDNDPRVAPVSGLDFNTNVFRVDLTAAF